MIHGCRLDSSGRQLYLVRSSNEASSSVERMYCDFLKLAHARKPRRSNDDTQVLAHKCDTVQAEGLPKKALKRLAAVAPWTRDGVGWRPDLIASVRRVELWLRNHTLGASTEFDVATAKFLSGAYDRAIGFEHEGALLESNVDSVGENNISKGLDNRSRNDNRINIGSKEIFVDDEGAEGISRGLQQFFCLPANLDALLLAAFGGLDDCIDEVHSGKESIDSHALHESPPELQLMSQEQHSNRRLRRQRRFVAVEPSCGDGRILARLCAMMTSSDASATTTGDQYAMKNSLTFLPSAAAVVDCCVGVELDPVMAETSRATVANLPVLRGISQPYGCPVVCNDFLHTSGGALAQALASYRCEHRDTSFGGDVHESCSQSALKRPRRENYSDGSEENSSPRSDGPRSIMVVDSSAWPPAHCCDPSGANHCTDTLEVLVVGGPPYTDYTAPSAQGGEDGGTVPYKPDMNGSRIAALTGTGLDFLSRGSSAVAAAAHNAVRSVNGLITEGESATESPPTTDAANQASPALISRDGEASLLDEEAANSRISATELAAPFRSLPLRFVLHAARPVVQGGLGATRVCYLLPARCAKAAFARAVAEGLRQHEYNCDTTSRDHRCGCDLLKGGDDEESDGGLAKLGWNLQCQPAPEQRFSFRGRLVPQPSVIWTITRSS